MLSIIVKNYNEEKYIISCLNSIISQIDSEDEIIIVDDGSTDGSANLIKKFKEKHTSKNIKYIYQENGGPGSACNTGINYSNNEYLYIVDGDDELPPSSILKIKELLNQNRVDLLIFDIEHKLLNGEHVWMSNNIVENKKIINPDLDNLVNLIPSVTNKVIKKSIIKNNDLVFNNYFIGEDLNFITKMYIHINSLYYSKDINYQYIQREHSLISSAHFMERNMHVVDSLIDIVFYYIKNDKLEECEEEIYRLIQNHGILFNVVRIVKSTKNDVKEGVLLINNIHKSILELNKLIKLNWVKKITIHFKNPKLLLIKLLVKLKLTRLLYYVIK